MTRECEIKAEVFQENAIGSILHFVYSSDLLQCDKLILFTYANDTVILSSHVGNNEIKIKHVTFSLRRVCPSITLKNVCILQSDYVTYPGFVSRQTCNHIESKHLDMKIKTSNLYWLITSKSKTKRF